MENEIYIASEVANKLKALPPASRIKATELINSLGGNGWENSQIVLPDSKPGGGLRAKLAGNIKLLFRYAPHQHAIIVADVALIYEHEFLATA